MKRNTSYDIFQSGRWFTSYFKVLRFFLTVVSSLTGIFISLCSLVMFLFNLFFHFIFVANKHLLVLVAYLSTIYLCQLPGIVLWNTLSFRERTVQSHSYQQSIARPVSPTSLSSTSGWRPKLFWGSQGYCTWSLRFITTITIILACSHPFQLSIPNPQNLSFKEFATYGPSYLLLSSMNPLNPSSFLLSNTKSLLEIFSLSSQPCSFFCCCDFAIGYHQGLSLWYKASEVVRCLISPQLHAGIQNQNDGQLGDTCLFECFITLLYHPKDN